ncbi:MAG: hypothetical protein H6Q33_657, partial [Deltaproteobacteria bacterium]|nr:hypothetical protein [Deltaproteobacteria bacterium]
MHLVRQSLRRGVEVALVLVLSVPATGWAQAAKGPKPAGAKLETEIEEITVTA